MIPNFANLWRQRSSHGVDGGEIMDAQTSNEISIAYLKRSIAAQEERIIAGLMKGVDTVEMEDRLQGDLAVLRRIQGESSSKREADGWVRNSVSGGGRQINGFYRPATSSVSSSASARSRSFAGQNYVV
jgi:hypothetical protein